MLPLINRHISQVITLTFLAVVGCETQPQKQPEIAKRSDRPIAIAVNFPLFDFARRIGGEQVDVRFPVPDGVSPSRWQPRPDEIKQLRQAELLITNGPEYSNWLQWVTVTDSKVLDTTGNIRDQMIPLRDVATHRHGPFGEQTQESIATHTWLNPKLAIEQCRAIEAAFSRLLPEHKNEFQRRLDDLTRDLESLDGQLEQVRKGATGRTIAAARLFDYLADRCDLTTRALDWNDREPTENDLMALDELLEEFPAKHVLWPTQPSAALRGHFASRGLKLIVFRPLAHASPSSDYIKLMTQQVAALAEF